jgi:hypothetical protein
MAQRLALHARLLVGLSALFVFRSLLHLFLLFLYPLFLFFRFPFLQVCFIFLSFQRSLCALEIEMRGFPILRKVNVLLPLLSHYFSPCHLPHRHQNRRSNRHRFHRHLLCDLHHFPIKLLIIIGNFLKKVNSNILRRESRLVFFA